VDLIAGQDSKPPAGDRLTDMTQEVLEEDQVNASVPANLEATFGDPASEEFAHAMTNLSADGLKSGLVCFEIGFGERLEVACETPSERDIFGDERLEVQRTGIKLRSRQR
jgi:hypothetical protein